MTRFITKKVHFYIHFFSHKVYNNVAYCAF